MRRTPAWACPVLALGVLVSKAGAVTLRVVGTFAYCLKKLSCRFRAS